MSVLIVIAHPDDEVLGCGGTVALLAERGIPVHCCILSGQVTARQHRPEADALAEDMRQAHGILGIQSATVADFPNIEFNTVPHLHLVQFIEEAVARTGAQWVFTHHPNDLNRDHHETSLAAQAAARLFQRRPGVPRLRGLYFMEILSSTDWAFPSGGAFSADTFVEIGKTGLERKIEALRAYRGVMRDFPHPRSPEILQGLAAYRGGQAGMHYAEAFQTAFRSQGVADFA